MRVLILSLNDEEPEDSVYLRLAQKHPHDEILSVCFSGQGLERILAYLRQIDHAAYSHLYVIGDFQRLVIGKSQPIIKRYQQDNFKFYKERAIGTLLEPFVEQLDLSYYNRKMQLMIQLMQMEYPGVKWLQIQGKHPLEVIEPMLGLRWQEDEINGYDNYRDP